MATSKPGRVLFCGATAAAAALRDKAKKGLGVRAPGSSSPLPLPLSLSRPGRPPQPGGRARVGRPAAGRAGGVGCERQRILPPGGPHRRGRSLHLGPGHGAARGWGVRKKTEGGEQNCELTRCMRTRAGSWATATRRRATRPLWLPPWRAIRLLRLRAGRRALRPAGPPRNSLTRCCLARLSPLQSHTLVVTSSGECFAFGSNKHGQLGTGKYSKPKDGVEDGSALPLPCATPPGVASVAAGAEFSLFLCSDGALLSCGLPQHGVLGHGTDHEYNSADGSVKLVYAPQPTPKAVASFASAGLKVAKVAAGHAHCVAIDDKGHVWTWGNGNYGCLVRFFPFPSAQSSMFSLIYLPPPPRATRSRRTSSCRGRCSSRGETATRAPQTRWWPPPPPRRSSPRGRGSRTFGEVRVVFGREGHAERNTQTLFRALVCCVDA